MEKTKMVEKTTIVYWMESTGRDEITLDTEKAIEISNDLMQNDECYKLVVYPQGQVSPMYLK